VVSVEARLKQKAVFRAAFQEILGARFSPLWQPLRYYVVLISIRVPLLILADTSCNERGIAEYNRIHTASRPDLEVFKLRDLFAIKHYGPKSVHEFNAEGMYGRWLRAISEGGGVSFSAKRQNSAVLRKIMNVRNRGTMPPCAGSNAAGFAH
jgi:hypothetical protein